MTVIEEAQNIANMKVKVLIGSLQTFEMAMNDQPEKKHKGIAFWSNTSDDQTDSELETDEEISEAVVLLGRYFNNVLKRLERGQRPNVRDIPYDIEKNSESQKKTKAEEQPNIGKGP